MKSLSTSHGLIAGLAWCLFLAIPPDSHAGAWPTEEWNRWDAAASPTYPGETWLQYETPEDAGWSSERLAATRKHSEAVGTAAVTVIYNGAVVAQWGQVARRFMCHSVRKSLLSALYGIAVAKGEIDIDETIGAIGIDDDTGLTAAEKSAKVSDLLKARSGIYLPAAYETPSMKQSRPARGSHAPGTYWYYNNWDFNALATIFNKKTGGDLFEVFRDEIATPLQMQDFALRHTYYHLEPENSRHPAYPFRMSARDLARVGLLFLNEGKWRDKEIIPADWVRESTRPHSQKSKGGYGYMWWTLSGPLGELGAYAAAGYGGHRVYVVPAARLVVVHRADTYGRKQVERHEIRRILLKIIGARTGPPRDKPRLVAVSASSPDQTPSPGPALTAAQRALLSGTYRRDDFVATVAESASHLEIASARWGRFRLIPRSATTFLVEDAERRLEFDLDDTGRASALTFWKRSGERYLVPRVR